MQFPSFKPPPLPKLTESSDHSSYLSLHAAVICDLCTAVCRRTIYWNLALCSFGISCLFIRHVYHSFNKLPVLELQKWPLGY